MRPRSGVGLFRRCMPVPRRYPRRIATVSAHTSPLEHPGTGDAAGPSIRLRGETEVVAAGDRLVANTDDEAQQLIGHYDADPARVTTINPGVDLSVFRPGSQLRARQQLGLPSDGVVLVFAGRVQPLKAPDIVLHTAAQLIRDDPSMGSRLTVAFVGGPSGTGRADPDGLIELAARLGLTGRVRL